MNILANIFGLLLTIAVITNSVGVMVGYKKCSDGFEYNGVQRKLTRLTSLIVSVTLDPGARVGCWLGQASE